MQRILALLLLCSLALPTFALAQGGTYFHAQEYLKRHPGQAQLTEAFNKLVEGAATRNDVLEPVRIAIVYPGLQTSDYWRRSISSFTSRLVQRGIPYKLDEHFTRPSVAQKEQRKHLATFLSNDPDYLVFTLDTARQRRLLERILTRPRPKVILQNITTPLRAWESKQPFLYVGFDHVIGTELLATEYINRTSGQGQYAALLPLPGYLNDMRGSFFLRYLNEHSDLQLQEAFHLPIDRQRAYQAAKAILSDNPKLQFIYAATTDLALGAADAIHEAGLTGKVLTNGWGGGSAELEAVQQKRLDFTVMRMNDDSGVAMADAIWLDRTGKGDKVPTIFSGAFVLVDTQTSRTEIDRLQQRAFRYSSQ